MEEMKIPFMFRSPFPLRQAARFVWCRKFCNSSDMQIRGGCPLQHRQFLLTYKAPPIVSRIRSATYTPLAEAWDREWVTPLPSPIQ